MRILVAGGDGMLGHELLSCLAPAHDVGVTLRRPLGHYSGLGLVDSCHSYAGVDVRDSDLVATVVEDFQPDVILNAVGIVKQRSEGKQYIPSIEVNALFPHRLAVMARESDARLVHFSTDCVFSGRGGGYEESALPDPVDLYGRSKLLGELDYDRCLTLRTSIIGLELSRRQGLVEWALAQTGEIPGYRRAIYSGLTTIELARLAQTLICEFPQLNGVWHVAAEPISKYELLVRLFSALGRSDVTVLPDDSVVCDRSLRSDRFSLATGYRVPGWESMLGDLAKRVFERKGASG